MLKSTNREDLEKWLRAQPREVSVAIAARAALRVFPALDGVFNASRMKTASAQELSGVFIYVFQSIAFPVGAVRYPRAAETLARTVIARPAVRSTAYLDAAAFAAHTALVAYLDASEVAKHQILNNASDPAGFAAMATNSALSVFRSGAGNNAAARLASNTADSDLWLVINSDKSFIDGGGTAQQLAARPLWPASVPGLISEDWGNLMSELLALNEGWEVWTTWYDAVLQGKPTPGGEELDIFRVLLNEESDWEKGPKHVNGLIRAKEEEIARRHVETDVIEGLSVSDQVDAELLRGKSKDEALLNLYDLGLQNSIAISFAIGPDGRVDVSPKAGSESVSHDQDTVDSHSEVLRLADELVTVHGSNQIEPNNGNSIVCSETRLMQEAIGRRLNDIRPGLLIPRGEALRQTLKRHNDADELTDFPPISESMRASLSKLVGAYNAFVGMDSELSRRDNAVLGPDAKRKLVAPKDAISAADNAASLGAATEQAAGAVREEAANAPAQPDPDDRNSQRSSETAKNFARAVLVRAQALFRWVEQNRLKSTLGGAASLYAAANWALANEAWLTTYFADNPAMMDAISALLKFLKSLPLG